MRRFGRFVVVASAEGVIGWLAINSILAAVAPSPARDAVLLAIWPLVIVGGTVIGWQWLGNPETSAARNALTVVISSGRDLRRRLTEADEDDLAWRVRVQDW